MRLLKSSGNEGASLRREADIIPLHPQKAGLTKKLWGLDWKKHFPLSIAHSSLIIEVSTLKEVSEFAADNTALIFGDNVTKIPFLVVDQSKSRTHYYDEAGDFFTFKDENKIIGIFVGNVKDWSTYYWRSVAILPEYQGKGVYQTFLNHLLKTLTAHGIKRIEADIAPSNHESIHVLNKLKFHISGFHASERWGMQVEFTKFLDTENANVFHRQFCCGTFDSEKKKRQTK